MTPQASSSFHAVIMAGGSGTRFWPLSRRRRPKQLLRLFGGDCLLVHTLKRLQELPLALPAETWIVTGPQLADATRAAVPDMPPDRFLVEPEPRNTAPCICLAIAKIKAVAGDRAVTAFIPADQLIQPVEDFRATLVRAVERAASSSAIVTIGVEPDRPATGYGYLQRGSAARAAPDLYPVEAFTEKPDLEQAKAYLADGKHLWNTGMFVWRIDTVLAQMAEVAPHLHEATLSIAAAFENNDAAGVKTAFQTLPATSIDYALLEKSHDIEVVAASFEWSDVGAYPALATHLPQDEHGNRTLDGNSRRVVAVDSKNNIVIGQDEHVIALLGIEDLAIIHTEDATLICPKDRSEEIKRLVDELGSRGLDELL